MLNKLSKPVLLASALAVATGVAVAIYALVIAPPSLPAPTAPAIAATEAEIIVTRAATDAETQQFLLKKYGGVGTDATHNALVTKVGAAIATKSEAKDSTKTLRFAVLAEENAINSFALPTGDIYVTTALMNRMRTEGELAAVLANATAHVLSAHRMLIPGAPAAPIPVFTATQSSEADSRAIRIMNDAGYNPSAMLSMFQVLSEAYHAGAEVPFFTSHPSAEGRLTAIADTIRALYPNGVPAELSL